MPIEPLPSKTADQNSFDCPKYERTSLVDKRCEQYEGDGMCRIKHGPGGYCVLWLQANPHKLLELDDAELTVQAQQTEPDPPTAGGLTVPRFLPEDVERFNAMQIECKLVSRLDGAALWLVPTYTEDGKPEITLADLAKLTLVAQYFEGTRIVAFQAVKKEACQPKTALDTDLENEDSPQSDEPDWAS